MKKRMQGFTLIELVVVVSIVVIVIAALLSRVWYYQEQAEKTAMEQVASALQSALIMEYSSMMTHGKESLVSELVTGNPMGWLSRKPENYSGEFYDPTPRSVAPGNWVFDLKSRDLIYVVDRGEHFTPGPDGYKWVRYHVRLIYEELPGGGDKKLTGLLFEPVESYSWFTGGI
ncbi:MAG: prepilin-type N-terminal cleavage/methylation domain-containing protein [Sideroxydans sp.]|nr:prepilin-type N-terminal cleavage/methylation domain-containing protein [Sideroxydans sp.]